MSGSDPTPEATSPLADDAELARLRSQVAELEAQLPSEERSRTGWWRPVAAGFLVLVVALLAPLSVLSTWANGQIQDTDRYLETVAPLASDPDVQKAIAARVEEVIFSYLNVEDATDDLVAALTAQGLPERAASTLKLAVGPLSTAVRDFVSERILQFVQSDAFEEAWVDANREAHKQLVAALTGDDNGAVVVDRGTVTIQLATIIGTIKTQLVNAGFNIANLIPEVTATFTVLQSEDLSIVQRVVGFVDNLSTWLPAIGLGLLAIAVAIARDRRKVVLAAGVAVAGSMLLLGAVLNLLRPIYLDALPVDASQAAAGAIYDQLVSFIRFALRGLVIVAITVALGAWLSAPRGSGASARGTLVRGIDAARRGTSRAGLNTGRFGVALAHNKSAIRAAILVVVAVGYLSFDHPTGTTALWCVVGLVVALLLLEFLANDPGTDAAAGADTDPTAEATPTS